MKVFSMGVTTVYITEAMMFLSWDWPDEKEKYTALLVHIIDTTERWQPQVDKDLESLLVEWTIRRENPMCP